MTGAKMTDVQKWQTSNRNRCQMGQIDRRQEVTAVKKWQTLKWQTSKSDRRLKVTDLKKCDVKKWQLTKVSDLKKNDSCQN